MERTSEGFSAQVTPEQYTQLPDSESAAEHEQYMRRAYDLAMVHGVRLPEDNDENFTKRLGNLTREPLIGGPEPLEQALHGSQETFQNYVDHIFELQPTTIILNPELYSELYGPEAMSEKFAFACRYTQHLKSSFHVVAPYLTSELRQRLAPELLEPPHINAGNMAALHRYGLADLTVLQETVESLSIEHYDDFWGIQPLFPPRIRYGETRKQVTLSKIDDIKYLISSGIIDQKRLEHIATAYRTADDAVVKKAYGQYSVESSCAMEAVLIESGIIKETAPLEERVARARELIEASTRQDLTKTRVVNCLYRLGLYSKEELFSYLQNDADASYDELFRQYIYAKSLAASPLEKKVANNIITKAQCALMDKLQTVPDEKQPSGWNYEEVELLFTSEWEDKATQKALIDIFIEQNDFFTVFHWPKEFAMIFADEPEKRKRIFLDTLSKKPPMACSGDWRVWQESCQLTAAEAKSIYGQYFLATTDSNNISSLLFDDYRRDDDCPPLFSYEEWVDAFMQLTLQYASQNAYGDPMKRMINAVVRTQGANALQAFVGTLVDRLPHERLIDALVGGIGKHLGNCELLVEKTQRDWDYYDMLQLAYAAPNWLPYASEPQRKAFLDSCIETINDFDLYCAYYIWPFMDKTQQRYVCGKLAQNPVLAQLAHEQSSFKAMFSEACIDVPTIYEAPPESIALCPRSHKKMLRELGAKDDTLGKDSAARVKILFKYAYTYHLVNKIATGPIADDAQELLSILPQSKNVSVEQRNLEILELFQLRPAERDTTAEEMEARAWQNSMHLYGYSELQAKKLATILKAEGVDLIKVGMWAYANKRSDKTAQFFKQLLDARLEGASMQEWKFAATLPVDESTLKKWQEEVAVPVEIDSETYTFRLTHQLNGIYESGSRPVENCLHYAAGINQRGLTSLTDRTVKMLTIENGRGNPIGNAILRFAQTTSGGMAILHEPLYESINNSILFGHIAITAMETVMQHAQELGATVHLMKMKRQARLKRAISLQFDTKECKETLTIPVNTGPYDYSDATGIDSGSRVLTISNSDKVVS